MVLADSININTITIGLTSIIYKVQTQQRDLQYKHNRGTCSTNITHRPKVQTQHKLRVQTQHMNLQYKHNTETYSTNTTQTYSTNTTQEPIVQTQHRDLQ